MMVAGRADELFRALLQPATLTVGAETVDWFGHCSSLAMVIKD